MVVEYVIGDGACSVRWSCIAGEEGITMLGVEERKYVVTGYQAFGTRQFQDDVHAGGSGRHAVTTIRLRLDIKQQDGGPPGRRATVARIDFAAGAANQIGLFLPRENHPREFELDLTLPVADFDPYWNILQDTGQTQLSCEVELHGNEIFSFQITSPQDTESTHP
jgi:hypothetical protein